MKGSQGKHSNEKELGVELALYCLRKDACIRGDEGRASPILSQAGVASFITPLQALLLLLGLGVCDAADTHPGQQLGLMLPLSTLGAVLLPGARLLPLLLVVRR